GHETSPEMTRVILHGTGPIDYRGGALRGDQVILDLANVESSLAAPVVDLGAPEVDRVVIGPEINKDGDSVLKIRLTGVKARSHKITPKGNELYIDLTALKGARDGKGLPKVINNSSEVQAKNDSVSRRPDVVPASNASRTSNRMVAMPASEAVVDSPSAGATAASLVQPKPQPPVAAVVVAAPAAQTAVTPAAEAAPAPAVSPTNPPAQSAAMTSMTSGAGHPALPIATTPLMAAVASDTATARTLAVPVGRSLTLDTGVAITRVSVSNPAVAEPVAISPTQLLVNGLKPGTVSLVLWPKEGPAIVYELVVHIDSLALSQQMEAIFPGEKVRVQTSKDSVVLSGSVTSNDVGEKMMKLASDYSEKVVNHMVGPNSARKQVMLKVKFAEVNKSALTELGAVLHHVDPTNPLGHDRGSSGTGDQVPPAGNLINDPEGPDLNWGDAINLSFFEKSLDLGIFISALKSRGLFQELAEPTLIAADGQEASFLAGGEFPVPVAQPGANFVGITVVWKKFGISLEFKPTIIGDGLIVMKVKPEVSALDFANGVLIEGFRIPALTVRRAETEVELKDGQSFAIAGLYDKNLLQTKSKIPVLGDIPLLGYLFRSKGLTKNRTELLVIVTPTIVEPLGTGQEGPSLEMEESFDLDKPAKK
ncbi:MAG TPA: type II and III secretion system protein family protein, partial [Candidatus Polarisedimenticolia bacterium]|nr:type II and III secretion system protein family protein [Candidatus Polarisedimenticolia bacterium]